MHVGERARSDVRARAAAQITSILADIRQVADVAIADDDDFLRTLDMDSIDAVELTVQLDTVFGIAFGEDPDDVDHLASFGSLVDLVVRRARLPAAGETTAAITPTSDARA